MRYLPLTPSDRAAMLERIGAPSIDALFVDVPQEARLDGPIHGLPGHASEMAVERHLSALARRNMVAGDGPFFLGCGAYKHHVPSSVDHIIQRSEFLTTYTPYQPEIAQGTLQTMFEFQTQVAALTGGMSGVLTDPLLRQAQAVSQIADEAGAQAFVLAYNDAFLLTALAAAGAAIILVLHMLRDRMAGAAAPAIAPPASSNPPQVTP